MATGLSGLVTGSLAFASAVDVRAFKTHIQDEVGTNLARNHFMIWWPYGRDWMVPLVSLTTLANGVVWRMTKNNQWAFAGVSVSLIGAYTKMILMGEYCNVYGVLLFSAAVFLTTVV